MNSETEPDELPVVGRPGEDLQNGMTPLVRIGTGMATAILLSFILLASLSIVLLIVVPVLSLLNRHGVTFQEVYEGGIVGFRKGFGPAFARAFSPGLIFTFLGTSGWWPLLAAAIYLWWWWGEETAGSRLSRPSMILSMVPVTIGFLALQAEIRRGFRALARAGLDSSELVGSIVGESFAVLIFGFYLTIGIWGLLAFTALRLRRQGPGSDPGR